jgi:tetratricopeptide (TPR) repeat protein
MSQRIFRRLVLTVLIGAVCTAPLAAQSTALPAATTGQDLINEIYQQTRDAKTLQALVDVVARCEKTRSQSLSKEQRDYLYRLTAWAYNKRGEIYADQASALNGAADARRAKEMDALALADFEKAVQYDSTRWKAIHNRGVSYAMLGKYQEAVQDFTKTVELNAKYGNAWFNRAEIYYELGEYGKAVGDYDRAIKLSPQDVGAITNRGHAFFQLRRINEAIQDYAEAIRLNPKDADGFTNRGDAFMATGEWSKAAEDYERAIQVNRDSGRAYQSIAWQMATCPDDNFRAITEEDKQTAVRAAQQAIKLDGESADYKYLDTLAAAMANAGRFDEAKVSLAEAIQLAPDAEVPILRKRYQLYEQKQPYRQQLRTAFQADATRR